MISLVNSIQISIKCTFTFNECIILFEDIDIDIDIYMNFVCFVYCNIVTTHTPDGHTGLSFT